MHPGNWVWVLPALVLIADASGRSTGDAVGIVCTAMVGRSVRLAVPLAVGHENLERLAAGQQRRFGGAWHLGVGFQTPVVA